MSPREPAGASERADHDAASADRALEHGSGESPATPDPDRPDGPDGPDRARPERPERPPRPSDQDLIEFMSRTAGGLAHEIKNPLSTIAINLALLEEDWARTRPDGELTARERRSLKRVGTLKREVARLEGIVEEFLSFVRGAEINRKPQDIAAIVRDTLDFVEPEDHGLGIRHHADLPVGLPLVMLDEGAFRRALLNLFINARQAMPMGGELLVRLRRDGNWLELSVTDTGTGMRPEELEHCFDLYWSSKKNGTGLGLPTVKRILEQHGGAISVVSEVGRGTSFALWMPLVVELSHARRRALPASLDRSDSGASAANDAGGAEREA